MEEVVEAFPVNALEGIICDVGEDASLFGRLEVLLADLRGWDIKVRLVTTRVRWLAGIQSNVVPICKQRVDSHRPVEWPEGSRGVFPLAPALDELA